MNIDFNEIWDEKDRWKFIYEKFYRPLCFFSASLLLDEEKAQDVVQSVFIRLWHDKTVFQDLSHLRNFLYKSVRNATINEINIASNRGKILEQIINYNPELYHQDDHFHAMVRSELYNLILNAISRLPDRTAEVIRLALLEQKSNQEIAQLLSISVNTVKVHKNNAKKSLRHMLKDSFPTLLLVILDAIK